MRNLSVSVAVAALLVVATATAVVAVAADSTHDVSVVDAVDTPEETITIEGTEFPVDHIGVVDPGDPVTVEVTSEENYWLYLYNEDEQTEYSEYHSDSGTIEIDSETLDTTDLAAGTYMFSLDPDGSDGREAVAPLVVQGYDIDLDYPETVTSTDEIEISATVDPKDDLDRPDTIEGALWDGDDVVDLTLEQTNGETYETTASAADLGEGEYSLYVAVMSDSEVENYQTALAVENGGSVTIESDEDSDDDTSGGSGSDDDDGVTETDDDEGTESDDEGSETDDDDGVTETDDDEETDDEEATDESSDDGDPETSDDGETSDQDAGDHDETDDDTILQPSDTADDQADSTDDDRSDDTDDDSMGTGGIALVALAIAILGLGRRAHADR